NSWYWWSLFWQFIGTAFGCGILSLLIWLLLKPFNPDAEGWRLWLHFLSLVSIVLAGGGILMFLGFFVMKLIGYGDDSREGLAKDLSRKRHLNEGFNVYMTPREWAA